MTDIGKSITVLWRRPLRRKYLPVQEAQLVFPMRQIKRETQKLNSYCIKLGIDICHLPLVIIRYSQINFN
jgi:hypothetical protein